MKVGEVMVKKVVTLTKDDTLRTASRKFAENNISGAPVVENDKVIGIVSELDVLKVFKERATGLSGVFLPTPFDFVEIPLREAIREADSYKKIKEAMRDIGETKVEHIMRRGIITITPTATIEEAATLMVGKKVNRLPVVKEGKLVGIVTRGDILAGWSKCR